MRILKNISFFSLVAFSCSLISQNQPIRFIKNYNFGFNDGTYFSYNAIKKNNDYLICGLDVNANQNQNYCLGVICTDSMGIQKWQKYTNGPGNYRYATSSSGSTYQKKWKG